MKGSNTEFVHDGMCGVSGLGLAQRAAQGLDRACGKATSGALPPPVRRLPQTLDRGVQRRKLTPSPPEAPRSEMRNMQPKRSQVARQQNRKHVWAARRSRTRKALARSQRLHTCLHFNRLPCYITDKLHNLHGEIACSEQAKAAPKRKVEVLFGCGCHVGHVRPMLTNEALTIILVPSGVQCS